MKSINPLRIALIGGALVLLTMVYLFQHFNYFQTINAIMGGILSGSENQVFIVNRTARLVINDLLCMALIYGLFANKNYLKLAFYLFLVEILLILPIYLVLKLHWEGTSEISSPLLSPIHRMIVNPLLMVLLMVALYYQQMFAKKGD
ncbi:MAG: exosortase F system-associated protein [Cyclobacteriaceae bacterium]|nr:exosortase F system-associated protein [Cyclobacteriaceae bacterium]